MRQNSCCQFDRALVHQIVTTGIRFLAPGINLIGVWRAIEKRAMRFTIALYRAHSEAASKNRQWQNVNKFYEHNDCKCNWITLWDTRLITASKSAESANQRQISLVWKKSVCQQKENSSYEWEETKYSRRYLNFRILFVGKIFMKYVSICPHNSKSPTLKSFSWLKMFWRLLVPFFFLSSNLTPDISPNVSVLQRAAENRCISSHSVMNVFSLHASHSINIHRGEGERIHITHNEHMWTNIDFNQLSFAIWVCARLNYIF